MSKLVDGFKEFITRGNAVDLAVGVVIGAAFTKVVDSIVSGLINPLIAALFGEPNLDSVGTFTLNNAQFSVGVILTALINFLLVALAIYLFVVLPINKLRARADAKKAAEEAAEEETAADVALLTEIRDLLRTQR